MALLVCAACRGNYRPEIGDAANLSPFADAGTGSTFLVGTTVPLDGADSFDPDGQIRAYHWKIDARPGSSTTQVVDEQAATTALTLDAVGDYVLELSVTDDAGATDISTVRIKAEGPKITVDAGTDVAALWRRQVQLAGTVDVEAPFQATYNWDFISVPPGSQAVLIGASTLTPSFVADVEGTYVARLAAHTPHNTASDTVSVTATPVRHLLEYVVVDAEYSTALDRFVIASDVPAKLRLHDPATTLESEVMLAAAPNCVSVSPDGHRAAVGHNGRVTVVDLDTMTIVNTFTVPVNVGDAVYGADSRVHLFPKGGFGFTQFYSLDLASGTVTASTGRSVTLNTNARLQPGGLSIYGATEGVSPSDIEHYDVSTSPASYTRDSPYHGQYEMGGNLWFTSDGFSIITRGSNVFYASDNAAVDMTFRGTIGPGSMATSWVTQSTLLNKLATAQTLYVNFMPVEQIGIYDAQSLATLATIGLPRTPYNGTSYASVGKLVAYRSDSSKLYLLVDASATRAIYVLDP